MTISAKVGGKSARVDDRGHRCHGSNQMTALDASASPASTTPALRFASGVEGTSERDEERAAQQVQDRREPAAELATSSARPLLVCIGRRRGSTRTSGVLEPGRPASAGAACGSLALRCPMSVTTTTVPTSDQSHKSLGVHLAHAHATVRQRRAELRVGLNRVAARIDGDPVERGAGIPRAPISRSAASRAGSFLMASSAPWSRCGECRRVAVRVVPTRRTCATRGRSLRRSRRVAAGSWSRRCVGRSRSWAGAAGPTGSWRSSSRCPSLRAMPTACSTALRPVRATEYRARLPVVKTAPLFATSQSTGSVRCGLDADDRRRRRDAGRARGRRRR